MFLKNKQTNIQTNIQTNKQKKKDTQMWLVWTLWKFLNLSFFPFSQLPVYIKVKAGNVLVSQENQLHRFAEYYEELISDITNHSLNENYWKEIMNNSSSPQESWNIKNQSILLREINVIVFFFNEKMKKITKYLVLMVYQQSFFLKYFFFFFFLFVYYNFFLIKKIFNLKLFLFIFFF